MGRRLGWADFRDFVNYLPPSGDSALWRSRKPRSWWVTPELQALAGVEHVLALANWQRGGGKKSGVPAPKLREFPTDKEPSVKSGNELSDRRKAQAEHLRRRRAARNKKRR